MIWLIAKRDLSCLPFLTKVKGVDPTQPGTKEAVERIAPAAHSLYGDYTVLTSKHNAEATDSSYSTVFLGCHTDTTYYSEPYG